MSNQELKPIKKKSPMQIVEQAIQKYNINAIYVLISGGKDSSCVDHFIRTNFKKLFKGRIFTNTGIATQETRKFILKQTHENNIPLDMTWSSHNERFHLVCMWHGFAFAGNHGMWLGYLKQHGWYYYIKDAIKHGERPCLISGVRKDESETRKKKKKYNKKPTDVNANMIFVKPFFFFNGLDISQYLIVNDVKITTVYTWDDKSGECRCGSFPNFWDLKLLEKHDKLTFETIKWEEKMMGIVRERVMKANRWTDSQVANWYRLYTSKNKALRKSLTKRQKQVVCLTYFNKWGAHHAEDIEDQTTFEDFEVNEDLCGESCVSFIDEGEV